MKNVLKAVADFQQEVPTIHKGTQGYGYSYATLPQIFEVINPILKKHGLGFTQLINGDELKTIVFHVETGECLESLTKIPTIQLKGMNDFQSFGAGISYFRRYSLSSILGLITDKDTDGVQKESKDEPKPLPAITDERFAKALEKINEGKYTVEALMKSFTLTQEQKEQLC